MTETIAIIIILMVSMLFVISFSVLIFSLVNFAANAVLRRLE